MMLAAFRLWHPPRVKGAAPSTRTPSRLHRRRTTRKRRQKLKRRAREEGADESRLAPVQAREMGGPRAGLIVRPRNASDALS